MSTIAAIHIVSALIALAAGAIVLLRPKGGSTHRWIGRLYFAAMLTLNGTAFFIYRLFDGFGPFHAAALVSLATVVPGVFSARNKRPGWLYRHYIWMTFSYVGLLAATVSEALTRLPDAPFWGSVLLASGLTLAVGAVIIYGRLETTLERFIRVGPVE